jgi:hypothetical protein
LFNSNKYVVASARTFYRIMRFHNCFDKYIVTRQRGVE